VNSPDSRFRAMTTSFAVVSIELKPLTSLTAE